MLFRRLAVAFALLVGALASQLPEFTQQYRQRLGGAIDELEASLVRFDAEAGEQSLNRAQGIARLRANGDPLAQQRGSDIERAGARYASLRSQREAFATAGPVSQYAVLAGDLDSAIARRAYADYQPAIPLTSAGLAAGGAGVLAAWLLAHGLAVPFRRRPRPGTVASSRA